MSNKADATNKMPEKKREVKPRLRFPEFRDAGEWEWRQLRDTCERIAEKVGKAKLTPVSITAGYGFVSQVDKFGKDISGAQYENYTFLRRGDFAYNRGYSKKYPQGYICQLKEFDQAAASTAFICFRLRQEYEEGFFQGLFDSNFHGRQLAKYITSSARGDGLLNINSGHFFNIKLPFPQQLAEQQKIAACLSSLDELIADQAKRLDTLKAHKQGLLQQLFPADGETLPRLRFPAFRDAGEWEEKNLGQIGDILMCKRIFARETNDQGGVPFYKIGTLGGKPDTFISKELFEEYRSKYNFPRKGEILITCSGTIGKCLPYDGNDAYYQDSNIVWVDNPTSEIRNEFLYYIFLNVDWGRLNSTTITRIYHSDLRNLSIIFPASQSEQQKIADCLSSLDNLIAAHSRKLDALKAHKTGLMQQLFPAPEEARE